MNVLLIDDSEVSLDVYQGSLTQVEDARCTTFTSSSEALTWTHTIKADLIVVDYRMPTPDGIQFIEAFRTIPGNESSFIIMVTAETDRDVRRRALAAGANDFLTKPIDPIEFVTRVRNTLALAKSRRQLADRAAWLADEVEAATESIRAREMETIARLTRAAEFRDDVTGQHVIRVGCIAQAIGRAADLSEDMCEILLRAAPMHDIGKVATPDAVLLKPGPLTPDEMKIMQNHTLAGYDILKGSNSELLRHAADIALSHHEKFDGTGYPYGLIGADIPLFGRICAVADVFDALTSKRPYKNEWPINQAAAYIVERSGSDFDPATVTAFRAAYGQILDIKVRLPDSRSFSVRG